ncbi:MAG TPA: VOC family protein [Chloroflexia bacterium]|nr:VOC family protein [Chloroflexia bacterium]
MSTSYQVTFDCLDPDKMATFWAIALGYKKPGPPEGYRDWPEYLAEEGISEKLCNSATGIIDPEGIRPTIYFQKVHALEHIKNHLHLDLHVSGGQQIMPEIRKQQIENAATRLEAIGASKVRDMEAGEEFWIVMNDPEGNEFCLQ